MRAILYVLSVALVMGLAFWAYHQNYRTKQALGELEALRDEIARLSAELEVLNDEWAYLNRPDRLRELALATFDRLQLLPLDASQFGRVDEIAFPVTPLPVPLGPISEPIEVIGHLDEETVQ